MNYPEVYRVEMSGKMIKEILEDVCDNIFNPDPFFSTRRRHGSSWRN